MLDAERVLPYLHISRAFLNVIACAETRDYETVFDSLLTSAIQVMKEKDIG
jgi:hypothetical protein